MKPKFCRVAALYAFLTLPSGQLVAKSVEIDLAPYANGELRSTVFPSFPTGRLVPSLNDFGVPFRIAAKGNNYLTIGSASPTPVTISMGIPGVRKVFTLLQAYAPREAARICSVEFVGSKGARQKFDLWGGENIRDFFESGFTRTINHTSTRPAFELIGRGGAYTGNTSTGPRGFYDFDEQQFLLDDEMANQILESVIIDVPERGSNGVILMGLTVVTVEAVVPSIFASYSMRVGVVIFIGLAIVPGVVLWIQRWLHAPVEDIETEGPSSSARPQCRLT